MDEEEKTPQPQAQSQTSEQKDEWLCFKTSFEDLKSKVHLKKLFYEKTKLNSKNLRSNKKNATKAHSNNNISGDSPMLPKLSEDKVYQTAIPNTITYSYEGLGSRIYNCNFTNDGKFILVTSQTGTAFFKFAEEGEIALSKVLTCANVSWAITDSNISSDNRFMIHSTLSPHVHMFDLEKSKYVKQFNLKTGAQLNPDEDEEDTYFSWYSMLRVFSLKLSGDNTEVIAGCGRRQNGAPIQVFDITKNKVKHSIIAHEDDINTICYVDRSNSSIFISGSDDGLCKLWDTRILENNKPVGIFYGHFAGLTCVNSKEDNRYFISNSKDQSIKLWDLRKSTTEKKDYLFMKYDYRYQRPSSSQLEAWKKKREAKNYPDQSVMSFEGHSVCGTLIRCHFSPMCGTGQRYIYSGSYDGKVYIYDTVDGQNIACLDIPKTGNGQGPVVRDLAWHPYSQNLITTSFSGDFHRWEYMDLRDAEKIEEEGEWETDEEENGNILRNYMNAQAAGDDDEEDDDYEGEDDDDDYDDDAGFVPVDEEDDEKDEL